MKKMRKVNVPFFVCSGMDMCAGTGKDEVDKGNKKNLKDGLAFRDDLPVHGYGKNERLMEEG